MSSYQDSSECKPVDVEADLRSTYYMFRGGKTYSPTASERRARNWQKFAKRITDLKIHPRRYVRWAYLRLRTAFPVVFFNQIASEKLVQTFLKERTMFISSERLHIRLQLDTVAHQLKMERTIRDVLEDELLDLSDTIRYAVARKSGIPDIADRLQGYAELDLANEPVFSELLSAFLEE